MGRHRRSSTSSDSSRGSSSSSRRRRREERRREKAARRAAKEEKHRSDKKKNERAEHNTSAPSAGKARSSKLEDATALIEAALENWGGAAPPAASSTVTSHLDPQLVTVPSSALQQPLTLASVTRLEPPVSEEPSSHAPDIPVEKTRIYIGNINYAATESDVRSAFARFGELKSCVMRFDPDKGHHRGFAFVEYADPASVEMVYRMPPGGISFGGMPVRIDKPTVANGSNTANNTNGSFASGFSSDVPPIPPFDVPVGLLSVNGTMRHALAKQIAASRGLVQGASVSQLNLPPTGSAQSTAIFIHNMLASADEADDGLRDEVRTECAKFGVVLDVLFYMTEGAKAPTVAVEFSAAEAARACAAKMNGRIFDGRALQSGLLSHEFFSSIKS